MKLKHYYNMYLSNVKENYDMLSEITFTTILNKLCKLEGLSIPSDATGISHKTPLNELGNRLGGDFAKVILSLYGLGLENNDYFKYYILDKFTNGLYIDNLLTCVLHCAKKGQLFMYRFDLSNFTDSKPQPTIGMEYKLGRSDDIVSPFILYSDPFNGDMELEDFLSMVISDPFYLLNEDTNSKYIMEKLLNGVTCIPYSQTKYINIVGIPRNSIIGTSANMYYNTLDWISHQLLGKKVIEFTNYSEGKFIGDITTNINITQLTDNLIRNM